MTLTSNDVLIVIDIQNDFCRGGALPVSGGDDVIDVVHQIAPLFKHIILTQDWHPLGHISFAGTHAGKHAFDHIEYRGQLETLWPEHCVQGSWGAELHPRLHLPHAELILRKGYRLTLDSYSAFYENDHSTPTGLGGYLRERDLRRVFLAGLAYDYCVGFSAIDARALKFPVVVIQDACRSIDHAGSVISIEQNFSRTGVEVIQSESLLDASEEV